MHCMDLWIAIILIVAALVAGAAIGALIAYKKGVSAGVEQRKHEAETMVGSAEQQAARIVEDAEKDAEKDVAKDAAKDVAKGGAKDVAKYLLLWWNGG